MTLQGQVAVMTFLFPIKVPGTLSLPSPFPRNRRVTLYGNFKSHSSPKAPLLHLGKTRNVPLFPWDHCNRPRCGQHLVASNKESIKLFLKNICQPFFEIGLNDNLGQTMDENGAPNEDLSRKRDRKNENYPNQGVLDI